MNTPLTTVTNTGSRLFASAQPHFGQVNSPLQTPSVQPRFSGMRHGILTQTIDTLNIPSRERHELLWANIREAARTLALSADNGELAFDPKDVDRGLGILKSRWNPITALTKGSREKRVYLLHQIEAVGVHFPELAADLLAMAAKPNCSLDYIGKVIAKFNRAKLNRDDVYTIMDSLDNTAAVSQKTVVTRSHTLRVDNRFYCIVKSPPKTARPARKLPNGSMEIVEKQLTDGSRKVDQITPKEGDWIIDEEIPISPKKFADDYDLVEYTPSGTLTDDRDPSHVKAFNRKSFTLEDLQRWSQSQSSLTFIQKVSRRPYMLPNKSAHYILSRESLKDLKDPTLLDKDLVMQTLDPNAVITFETKAEVPDWLGLPYYNDFDYMLRNRIPDPFDARSLALFKRLKQWRDRVEVMRARVQASGKPDPAIVITPDGKSTVNPYKVLIAPSREEIQRILYDERALARNDVRVEIAANALLSMDLTKLRQQYPGLPLEKDKLISLLSSGFAKIQKLQNPTGVSYRLLAFAHYQDADPKGAALLLLDLSKSLTTSNPMTAKEFRNHIPKKYGSS